MTLKRLVLLLACCGTLAWAEPTQYSGWILTQKTGTLTRVIRSQSQLEEFRDSIPSKKPQMKRPAPANDDPVLTDSFDFSREMIVVAGRGDNLSARPELLEVRDGPDDSIETVWALPEKPPEAKPHGWGTYAAVRLPASKREDRFLWKGAE